MKYSELHSLLCLNQIDIIVLCSISSLIRQLTELQWISLNLQDCQIFTWLVVISVLQLLASSFANTPSLSQQNLFFKASNLLRKNIKINIFSIYLVCRTPFFQFCRRVFLPPQKLFGINIESESANDESLKLSMRRMNKWNFFNAMTSSKKFFH